MPAFAGMTILAPLNEIRWLARSLREEEGSSILRIQRSSFVKLVEQPALFQFVEETHIDKLFRLGRFSGGDRSG